jgi:hypothetical protein
MSGGGSGGGSQPTTNTTYTSNIPEYARPYVEQMLGTAQQQVYNYNDQGEPTGMKPYTPFSNDPNQYFAGFNPMQQQSFQGAANMGTSPQLDYASGLAGAAGSAGLGTQYQGGNFGPQQYGQQVGQYMSPYMQNVVDVQQREAQRQSDIAATGRGAQAAQAGAFGGSRQAIMDAEAARNLAQQKGDIQSQGLQSAYNQAQNQ